MTRFSNKLCCWGSFFRSKKHLRRVNGPRLESVLPGKNRTPNFRAAATFLKKLAMFLHIFRIFWEFLAWICFHPKFATKNELSPFTPPKTCPLKQSRHIHLAHGIQGDLATLRLTPGDVEPRQTIGSKQLRYFLIFRFEQSHTITTFFDGSILKFVSTAVVRQKIGHILSYILNYKFPCSIQLARYDFQLDVEDLKTCLILCWTMWNLDSDEPTCNMASILRVTSTP